jgi:hypothetical protein
MMKNIVMFSIIFFLISLGLNLPIALSQPPISQRVRLGGTSLSQTYAFNDYEINGENWIHIVMDVGWGFQYERDIYEVWLDGLYPGRHYIWENYDDQNPTLLTNGDNDRIIFYLNFDGGLVEFQGTEKSFFGKKPDFMNANIDTMELNVISLAKQQKESEIIYLVDMIWEIWGLGEAQEHLESDLGFNFDTSGIIIMTVFSVATIVIIGIYYGRKVIK